MPYRSPRYPRIAAGLVLLFVAEAREAQVPAPPAVNEDLKKLAAEVYVYAFPLVLMDITRAVMTDISSGDPKKASVNHFSHLRTFPDASFTDVVGPNADTLCSSAWFDLSQGPIVLSLPDTQGRYYLMPMLDAWTNVFAAPGKRTTGTKKGDYALTGPGFTGPLPKDAKEIRSPTHMVWMIGRIQTNGKVDFRWVNKLQDQLKLTPLSAWGKPAVTQAEAAPPPASVDPKTPPVEQIARMDAETFYSRLAALLPGNPPAAADAPMVEKMKTIGVVAGQPFDLAKLDPASVQAVEEGAKAALEGIVAAAKKGAGPLENGWSFSLDWGRYGTRYAERAGSAWMGLGTNAAEDTVYPTARVDADGQPLDGANAYVLHFDKGRLPPAEAFWSLTLYDNRNSFVDNPIDRYAIGDRDKIRYNPGGSLDIYIQNGSPGKDRESNWLPAPKDRFNLMLRLYWPEPAVLDGTWQPPAVKRAE